MSPLFCLLFLFWGGGEIVTILIFFWRGGGVVASFLFLFRFFFLGGGCRLFFVEGGGVASVFLGGEPSFGRFWLVLRDTQRRTKTRPAHIPVNKACNEHGIQRPWKRSGNEEEVHHENISGRFSP